MAQRRRPEWGFYGRARELSQIFDVLESPRFFFCAISGRRRIGKTTLIRESLRDRRHLRALYVQIPDSDERGVVQNFRDAVEDNDLLPAIADGSRRRRIREIADIRDFRSMASAIEVLCRSGVIVVMDEFQYFYRKVLAEFTSHLQAAVDRLRDVRAAGVIVLGSIHTEMMAVLEDRHSPLFNRVTHRLELTHWDFETLFEMFNAHGIRDARHRLFLWTLFEGVPKFYRDAHEEDVLQPGASRSRTLTQLFFDGASPLRDEAANWFLREFRGRYDSILKLLARIQPCSYGRLVSEYAETGSGDERELSGYLKILGERYRMVEATQPIFAAPGARKSRYVITDNFLSAWLAALARNVDLARIRPVEEAVERADRSLATHEGIAFEKMIRLLTEELSQKGKGGLALAQTVRGYWNKAYGNDIEIDIVAYDEDAERVRFGSCKRNESGHDGKELAKFDEHVRRFLTTREGQRFAEFEVERALYSPTFSADARRRLTARGYACYDIDDFARELRPTDGGRSKAGA
jgi:uncharacterized protein